MLDYSYNWVLDIISHFIVFLSSRIIMFFVRNLVRQQSTARRSISTSIRRADKVLAVLYPDPLTGYPPEYTRDSIPKITNYPDGQTTPTPQGIDFRPGVSIVV